MITRRSTTTRNALVIDPARAVHDTCAAGPRLRCRPCTVPARWIGGCEVAESDLDPGTPWRRELDSVGPALERWASHVRGEATTVTNVSSPANGMSSETVLFDLAPANTPDAIERYAARLAPLPELYPVFPTYD